ncbi:hypothetical protein BWI15_00150 [Kribbella sp. ALI-6-A]|uniref:maleylpyruvate isomerase family mycothiol-dependent enzyme n=1 Tax=Kribbella sp. ALI-6-A TaxID=1933817 RepID=UPI00097CA355|nr:maleylpyruvate isomerase family mycothiol-dependent enzyme [Kribbella sp. ALI-6-A]ONI79091.1 hypothetical protein BWI15_00150 [Kribbella sp. ALI-6-A]
MRTRQWVTAGTRLLEKTVASLDDEELDEPSRLPGWTRRHVIAHLAANADALGRLVSWAHTSVEQHMYASADQRDAEIKLGASLPTSQLRTWLQSSAQDLEAGMDQLSDTEWHCLVITGQGRTVPADELPWLRSREVLVHTIDLNAGPEFFDLPAAFCRALAVDICAKRSLEGNPNVIIDSVDRGEEFQLRISGKGPVVEIEGPLSEITAWLAGRSTAARQSSWPRLPAWL